MLHKTSFSRRFLCFEPVHQSITILQESNNAIRPFLCEPIRFDYPVFAVKCSNAPEKEMLTCYDSRLITMRKLLAILLNSVRVRTYAHYTRGCTCTSIHQVCQDGTKWWSESGLGLRVNLSGADDALLHGGVGRMTRCFGSAPGRNREMLGFVAVVGGRLQHDDDGVAGGGLGRHVDGSHGEDGKWREKELSFALDVDFLHKIYVFASVPARVVNKGTAAAAAAAAAAAPASHLSDFSPLGSTRTIQCTGGRPESKAMSQNMRS
jgi:hypothetical protein